MSAIARPQSPPSASGLRSRKIEATVRAYLHGGLAADTRAATRLAIRNLGFTAGYYARLWPLLATPTRRSLLRTVRPEGEGPVIDAAAAGLGVVLVAAHLGDFDLAGHWVSARTGRRLVIATELASPTWRGGIYDRIRESGGFRVRRLGTTTLRDLADDLTHGDIVLVMADRQPAGRTLPATLLGAAAVLSTAPTQLSAVTGAPIISAATLTTRACRIVSFGRAHSASDASDHAWAPAVMSELGDVIHRAPQQWHVPADTRQLPWTEF